MVSSHIDLAHVEKRISQHPSPNLYGLDLFLWLSLQAIARAQPEKASEFFSVPQEAVSLLATADECTLHQVASGVLCSMRLVASENDLIRGLMGAERLMAESPAKALTLQERTNRTLQDLAEDYLRYARDSVVMEGESVARLRFDLPLSLLRALKSAADYQIRAAARIVDCRFEVRFSHDCLSELLTREHKTHFKIVQYEQILGGTQAHFIPMRETEREAEMHDIWEAWRNLTPITCDAKVESDQADSTTAPTLRGHDPKWIYANAMGRQGFARTAVGVEAGITGSQLSRLRKELVEQGVDITNFSKRQTSGRFIDNYQKSLHASIAMRIYVKLVGSDSAYQVDTDAIVAALAIYKQMRIESESNNAVRWPEITAVEGYVLAKEMRGDGIQPEAYMEDCCDCSAKYFVSIYQNISDKLRCPYCRVADAKRMKAA